MQLLREEPWRLFFPLGGLLGGVGVGHWLAYALGLQESYTGQGHALVQLQGFLLAFACGFLLTMLPRRTRTAPASVPVVLLLAAGLIVTGASALGESWLISEASFALVLLLLSAFAGWRLRPGTGRRAPDAFVLIPIGLAGGILGAALLATASLGLATRRAHLVGKILVEEGLFLCLLLGVGAMVLPLLSGRPTPEDADDSPASLRSRLLHALAGLTILASLPLQQLAAEVFSPHVAWRCGYGLRGAVTLLVLVLSLGVHRRPTRPGTARWLLWIAFWLVPAGLLLVALWPAKRVAFLHVFFIGGLGLMALALGAHVTLGHAGFHRLRDGKVWRLRLAGAAFLVAMTTRVSADFIPESYVLHLAGASGTWLVGLLLWLWLLLPKMLGRRSDS